MVGEGFLGATTSSDAAATEIGRIVDRFLSSMRATLGQIVEAVPIDVEMLAPVRDLARGVDVMLATGDVSALSGMAEAINTAGEILATRITGGYEVDEFGFDEHFYTNVWLPLWRPLFEHWFRVEVIGADNIPDEGAGLIVSNHAGVLPLDGLMTSVAVHDHGGRALRLLAADLAMTLPVSAPLARRAGATLACNADADDVDLRRWDLARCGYLAGERAAIRGCSLDDCTITANIRKGRTYVQRLRAGNTWNHIHSQSGDAQGLSLLHQIWVSARIHAANKSLALVH